MDHVGLADPLRIVEEQLILADVGLEVGEQVLREPVVVRRDSAVDDGVAQEFKFRRKAPACGDVPHGCHMV